MKRPITAAIGAAAELKVSADLLLRGFEVYRSLSPASTVDLIAHQRDTRRGDRFWRVQVKSNKYDKPHRKNWDLLAYVVAGKVYYTDFSKRLELK